MTPLKMENNNYNRKDLEECLQEVENALDEVKSVPKKKRYNKHALAFELLSEEIGFVRSLIEELQKKSQE